MCGHYRQDADLTDVSWVRWWYQRRHLTHLQHLLNGSAPPGELLLSHSVVSGSLQPQGLQLPASSDGGILRSGMLEWVAIFFRGSS